MHEVTRILTAIEQGDTQAAEQLPQLIRPPGPGVADHADGVRSHTAVARPLEQEARDGLVEDLIG